MLGAVASAIRERNQGPDLQAQTQGPPRELEWIFGTSPDAPRTAAPLAGPTALSTGPAAGLAEENPGRRQAPRWGWGGAALVSRAQGRGGGSSS